MLFKMLLGLLRAQESNVEGHSCFSKLLRVKSHLDLRSYPIQGLLASPLDMNQEKKTLKERYKARSPVRKKSFRLFLLLL